MRDFPIEASQNTASLCIATPVTPQRQREELTAAELCTQQVEKPEEKNVTAANSNLTTL